MPQTLKALDKNLERYALLFFYSLLVITMAVEVVRRELFAFSSIWGEEIVRYSFIYLVWIGAAVGVRERAHIRIDLLFNYLKPKIKAGFYLFGDFVMLFVAVIALYWSFESVMISLKYGSVTHGLRISQAWFLAAVPLGFSIMMVRLLQSIYRDFQDLRKGKPVFEGNKLFD